MNNILIYVHTLTLGGVSSSLLMLVNYLLENGYKVDVLVDIDLSEKNFIADQLPKTVRVSYVKNKSASRFVMYLRDKGKKVKIYNYILYLFFYIYDFYFFMMNRSLNNVECYDSVITFHQFLSPLVTKFGKKNILWLHGSIDHFFGGNKKLIKLFSYKLKKYEKIVSVSETLHNQVKQHFSSQKDKSVVIYNAFDVKEILSKSCEESDFSFDEKQLMQSQFICSVSRLDEGQKDNITLINAFARLKADSSVCSGVNLVILGDGVDQLLLKNLVQDLGLTSSVFFLGAKRNPFIWMRKASCFVLSSKFEGFGMVLVEAMLCRCPVVSSDCAVGPSEILNNGEYGDLFPVGDVNALCELLKNQLKSRNETRLDNAYIRASSFDKSVVLPKLLEILR